MTLFVREQPVSHQHLKRAGFALPTILIASIVMLTVLLVSVSSTSTVRTALKSQYYEQLAQVAGEAGIAYAEACLNANANVPQWSNGSPLKPNTDCTGTETVSCPTTSTNALCSVSKNGNVRSSFSLGAPTLDSNGKALTLPNTGYVEVLRNSNSQVWRRYDQKVTQSAVVPDLCSGAAGSIYGWNNAQVRTGGGGTSFPEPSALAISITSAASTNPGPIYLRKDFSITDAGNYVLNFFTNDDAFAYIDGSLIDTSTGTYDTDTIALGAGCHTMYVKMVNDSIAQTASIMKASLEKEGAATPIMVSDTSWRVAAGATVHYSSPAYYADPASWTAVRDVNDANTASTNTWTAASGDAFARFLATTHNNTGGNYPATSYAYFRDSRDIVVTANTPVKISYLCDDACSIYMDGQEIAEGTWNAVYNYTTTLTPGAHRLGVNLYNNSLGASGFAVTVQQISNSAILTRSDNRWMAANFWNTPLTEYYSYDDSFVPNPNLITGVLADALIVAGGGGAGGGGAGGAGGGGGGGVITTERFLSSAGTYPIVVGAGGAGGASFGVSGSGSSAFGLVAVGGGYGSTGSGAAGGSGGGSGRLASTTIYVGTGIAGQGSNGGSAGFNSGQYPNSGGGGASGLGGSATSASPGTSGAGGVGVISYITGSLATYGGGGGGGGDYGCSRNLAPGVGGPGGGGNGGDSVNGNGATATVNTGGGGGGATQLSTCTTSGTAGNGGSGIVVIRYPAGKLTATGGNSITTVNGYTIHTFTSGGTFTVTSIP